VWGSCGCESLFGRDEAPDRQEQLIVFVDACSCGCKFWSQATVIHECKLFSPVKVASMYCTIPTNCARILVILVSEKAEKFPFN
jgi:hypothetical protein